MESRIAELLGEFTPTSVEQFEAVALRELADVFGCDGAWFATIGPRFVERSPFYFQQILADPQRFDPGHRKAREIAARFGPAFIDTEAYTRAERDRLPIFRELLRPAGISSVALVSVHLGERTTGIIHLARGGRRFPAGALAEAQPLVRAVSVLHYAIVGAAPNYAGGAVHRVAETLGRLSPREAHVASLAADGYGALQIATRLGTSVHTVRRQLESVYRKCAIGNRAELASLVHTARQVTGFGAAGTKLRLRTHLARILGAFDLLPAVGPANWQVFG